MMEQAVTHVERRPDAPTAFAIARQGIGALEGWIDQRGRQRNWQLTQRAEIQWAIHFDEILGVEDRATMLAAQLAEHHVAEHRGHGTLDLDADDRLLESPARRILDGVEEAGREVLVDLEVGAARHAKRIRLL